MATETSTKLTYEDYVNLPNDGKRYEIIDGELYVNPAPNTKHQRVGKLYRILAAFVEQHRLGEVFIAPYDVVLSDIDIVEPDLLFVSAAFSLRARGTTTKRSRRSGTNALRSANTGS